MKKMFPEKCEREYKTHVGDVVDESLLCEINGKQSLGLSEKEKERETVDNFPKINFS